MKLEDFFKMIDADDASEIKECDDGFVVINSRWETKTHLTKEAIEKNTEPILLSSMIHGKDVDHITRITGYFSKVSGWNKGKKAELFDRTRTKENEW